ncbi:hypothetical protein LTR85_009016 [Meristemomyces frigidus]|nr:hypothetical protein LTR85_009016 [Meristemomyces frigidus]
MNAPPDSTPAVETSFFDLPSKLRNTIYELVLPFDQTYRTLEAHRDGGLVTTLNPLPAITAVCHQTCAEALSIWRRDNIFTSQYFYNGGADPSDWLLMLAKSGLEHIQRLEIEQRLYLPDWEQGEVVIRAVLRLSGSTYRCIVKWPTDAPYDFDVCYTRLAHGKARGWAAMIGTLARKDLVEADDSPIVTGVRYSADGWS